MIGMIRRPTGRGNIGLQVLVLLAVATALDYLTGPKVTAAAFYVFPVALAGWRLGWEGGVVAALAAMAINVPLERAWEEHPLSNEALVANEAVRSVVLLLVAGGSAVFKRHQKAVFTQRDELASLNRRLEGEMHAARSIQQALTSQRPAHPCLEIAQFLQPARILCGDTVHLSLGPDDVLAFAVADVSGKGAPAALAGAVLIGLLEDAPTRYTSPGETLGYLNERLVEYLPTEMFITVFYGLLSLRSGDLSYASAGHEPPFLLPSCGIHQELACCGLPLGLFTGADYSEQKLCLRGGDTLFVYSDGLPDHRLPSGERIGEEGLAKVLGGVSWVECDALLQQVLQDVVGSPESSEDDITMLAVRFLGAESSSEIRPIE